MKFEDREIDFNEAMEKLEVILKELEESGNNLEKSLELYEKGMELCSKCRGELDNAKLRIEYIDDSLEKKL